MSDENERIKLLKENLYSLTEHQKLQKEIAKTHEVVREKALAFIYRIITVIGLIAGFGFTAISHVESLEVFLLGQFILFLTIAVAMFWIKRTFLDEASSYAKWILELSEIIDGYTKIDPRWEAEKMKEAMQDIKSKSLNLARKMRMYRNKKPSKKERKFTNNTITFLLFLFLLGSIILLRSFVDVTEILARLIKY